MEKFASATTALLRCIALLDYRSWRPWPREVRLPCAVTAQQAGSSWTARASARRKGAHDCSNHW